MPNPVTTAVGSAVGVAVVQFVPTSDTENNLQQLSEHTSAAVSRGARLIVFPEYSSFFEERLGPGSVAAAQPLDGAFVTAIAAMATAHGVFIVAGMLEHGPDAHRASNTVVALDPSGALVAVYRKQHLYDAFGQLESEFIAHGPLDPPEVFVVDGLTVGIQTCYDLRFPEVTRRIVDAGADVVVVPSEWVRGPLKEHHWRVLVTARAIENTIFVAAADHAPPIGVGNSMIVDPMGVELATIGDESGVAFAWISRQRIELVRAINPALALRRFTIAPIDHADSPPPRFTTPPR